MHPKITEFKYVPLENISIGKGQVRVSHLGDDMEELAESIKTSGLLQPILLAPIEGGDNEYQVINGQRRFAAHQELGKTKIMAGILEKNLSEIELKILSLTENLVRKPLIEEDIIDACTTLYKKYGSIESVCTKTGLSRHTVSKYVKYDQLHQELKQLVDSGQIKLNTALRATSAGRAATGELNLPVAIKFAKEFEGMTSIQQKKVMGRTKENPAADPDKIIEEAKSGGTVHKTTVILGPAAYQSLRTYAAGENQKPDEAAGDLIENALTGLGYEVGEVGES